ncbi:hypothetical protein J437_LFUL005713 [Ladona fulva]|uniref:Uncharacterized protein n=1 Tax=Ladona fulva TaxID=123851 RepID=A0A8K0NZM5_LADFU|nr:hypothetical protein J437_LFUL005713 [Ladona fulva]
MIVISRDVEKLVHEGIEKVTPQRWADIVRHIEKELGDAWKNEGILEECMEQMFSHASLDLVVNGDL